jgi:predicted Zn finger-like uncharacterized protein
MNVACPSCQTRYSVEDHRIPPSGVTIKCPKCSHSFVVKKDQPPPRELSAVPLPGVPAQRAGTAVPLPGSRASNIPDFATDPSLGDPPGARGGQALGQSGVLNFIDDTAQRAGVPGGSGGAFASELRIRRSSGAVEGPFGVQRIITMLRNSALSGAEEVSEDGHSWRPMGQHADLARVISELRVAQSHRDGLGFSDLPGLVDKNRNAPAPSDLPGLVDPNRNAPAPANLPGVADPFRNAPAPANLPASTPFGGGGGGAFGGLDGGSSGGSPFPDAAPFGAPATSPFGGGLGGDDEGGGLPSLGGPIGGPAGPAGGPLDHLGRGGRGIDPNLLEVGEIPQLPSIWEQYRKPILGFAVVMTVAAIGLATSFSSIGPFGVNLLTQAMEPEKPPPPPPPPVRPPQLADAGEIRRLIDEGSFEAFRSVLATMQSLGTSEPDNLLAFAKAHGLATLYYGEAKFPIPDLAKAVEALNTLDLTKAQGGNAELANLEILKARSALEIAQKSAPAAVAQLEAAFEANPEDKEIALLLGLARAATGEDDGALKALDRAVVVDTGYAPALHAIGDLIANNEKLGSPADGAWWYEKAIVAEPNHTRSAVKAAEIYGRIGRPGKRRQMFAAAADHVDRGLPDDDRPRVNFSAAIAFERAGRAKDGLKYAREAARLVPAENQYAAAAAVALVHAGKPKEALELLDPALGRSPEDAPLLLASARAQMALDEIPKAFAQIEAAKRAQPRFHEVHLWEGRFNQKLSKLDDARLALRQAAQLAGEKDVDPTIFLGELELAVGNVDGALEHARRSVEIDSTSPRAHALLGESFRLRDEFSSARASFEKALDLDPEIVEAKIGLANTLRDLGGRALRPESSPELARAMPIYIETLRENPNHPKVVFEYGRALELQNKLDAALQLYRDAASLDDKDPRPHLAIVAAYVDRQNPDLPSAKVSLAKAESISPNDLGVRYWSGRVALAEGDLDLAQRRLEAVVNDEPRNAWYRYWLGQVHDRRDSLFEAISEYETAIRLNSRLAPAYRALAWAAISRNQFSKANEYFSKFRDAAPDDHTIWVDIGQMWSRQNRHGKAVKAFKEALAHDPKNATALLGMGNIESVRGNDAKALEFYAEAAQADVYNGEALCQYAITLANDRGATYPQAKDLLQRCLAMASAPQDRKITAQTLLDSVGPH